MPYAVGQTGGSQHIRSSGQMSMPHSTLVLVNRRPRRRLVGSSFVGATRPDSVGGLRMEAERLGGPAGPIVKRHIEPERRPAATVAPQDCLSQRRGSRNFKKGGASGWCDQHPAFDAGPRTIHSFIDVRGVDCKIRECEHVTRIYVWRYKIQPRLAHYFDIQLFVPAAPLG